MVRKGLGQSMSESNVRLDPLAPAMFSHSFEPHPKAYIPQPSPLKDRFRNPQQALDLGGGN